jgi:hypothetical protein
MEFVCAVVEDKIHGKRELIRFLVVLCYSIIGIFYCFGNGFYNVIFVDSFVNLCSIIGALL